MDKGALFQRRIVRVFLSVLLSLVVAVTFIGCGDADIDSKISSDPVSTEEGLKIDEAKMDELREAEKKGLLILVNKENSLDASFVPEDLEPIKYYAEDRNKYSRFMRAEAAEHFHQLVEAADADGIDIVMTTAYRSYEFQKILWDNYVAQKGEEEANKTSARPGESEHSDRSCGRLVHVGN